MASNKDSTAGEELYEVERVLDFRMVRKKKEYLVRWVGWAPEWDTWEPESNLISCHDLIEAFWKKRRTEESTSKEETLGNIGNQTKNIGIEEVQGAVQNLRNEDVSSKISKVSPVSSSSSNDTHNEPISNSLIDHSSTCISNELETIPSSFLVKQSKPTQQSQSHEEPETNETDKPDESLPNNTADDGKVVNDELTLSEKLKKRRGQGITFNRRQSKRIRMRETEAALNESFASEVNDQVLSKVTRSSLSAKPSGPKGKSKVQKSTKSTKVQHRKNRNGSSTAKRAETNRQDLSSEVTQFSLPIESIESHGQKVEPNIQEIPDSADTFDPYVDAAIQSVLSDIRKERESVKAFQTDDLQLIKSDKAECLQESNENQNGGEGTGAASAVTCSQDSSKDTVLTVESTTSSTVAGNDSTEAKCHPKLCSANTIVDRLLIDLEETVKEASLLRSEKLAELTMEIPDNGFTMGHTNLVCAKGIGMPNEKLPAPSPRPSALSPGGQWRPLKRDETRKRNGGKLVMDISDESVIAAVAIGASSEGNNKTSSSIQQGVATSISANQSPNVIPPRAQSVAVAAAPPQAPVEPPPIETEFPDLPLPVSINLSLGDFFKTELIQQNQLNNTKRIVTSAHDFESACCRGDVDTVRQTLLASKKPNTSVPIDLNIRNASGETILMRVCFIPCDPWHKLDDIIDLLAMNGANLNTRNGTGDTALTMAISRNHVCKVTKLLALGAAINLPNRVGETPLMLACKKNYLGIVYRLLDYGADFNAQSAQGKTALDIAQEMNANGRHNDCVNALRSRAENVIQAFDTQLRYVLPLDKFRVIFPLFPLHCYALNESNAFRIVFIHNEEPVAPSPNQLYILAVARGRFCSGHQVDVRVWGTTPVEAVHLNQVEQEPVANVGKFLYSLWPLRKGLNDLKVTCNKDCKQSQHKLLIDAYAIGVLPC